MASRTGSGTLRRYMDKPALPALHHVRELMVDLCRPSRRADAPEAGAIEAPMMATGFPFHALSPKGLDAQSIAFFNTPGME